MYVGRTVAHSVENCGIMSVSLGSYGRYPIWNEVIAWLLHEKNVVTVVAAGNNRYWASEFSPAYVPWAVTVGATDYIDATTGIFETVTSAGTFTNIGMAVDIWAPGKAIASKGLNNVTETWDGTSMACPHVSGAFSLIWNPNVSAAAAVHLLKTQ